MTITKIKHSGALQISDIVRGYLVTRMYCGYSKRQAMALFKRYTLICGA